MISKTIKQMHGIIACKKIEMKGVELASWDGFHFTGFQTIRDNKVIKNTYKL